MYNFQHDCILITESWLNSDIPNSILDPKQQYHIIRQDRHGKIGGGVCAFLSKRFKFVEIPITDKFLCINMIAFNVFLNRNFKCYIVVVYRPPNNSHDCLCDIEILKRKIEYLATHGNPICVTGDLNSKDIDWTYLIRPSNNISELLYDTFCLNGFNQYVPCATRNDSLLDVVCTNEPGLVYNIATSPPLGNSDHDCVKFSLNIPTLSTPYEPSNTSEVKNYLKKYLWKEANFDLMRMYLSQIDWASLLTVNFTPDDLWSSFCAVLYDVIDNCVPFKWQPSTSLPQSKRCRLPKPLSKLKKSKLSKWRAHKANPNDISLKVEYNKVCAEYRRSIRDLEIQKEREVIESNNLGTFYKFVNSKIKSSSEVCAVMDANGNPVVDDYGKANVLNNYFSSIGVAEGSVDQTIFNADNDTVFCGQFMESVDFDCLKIVNAAKRIKAKCKMSCDHEGFPTILIKKMIDVLCYPLSLIYNSFISVGKLPTSWKTAVITPIFKKGLASDPANYRPISCTSIFCKLLERIIATELTDNLQKAKLLDANQHGFIRGKSTVTNLIESIGDWTEAMDSQRTTTIIYIDFKKAFDSVPHQKLILKLKLYGISGNLLSLITNFLSYRTQKTKVGSSVSEMRNVNSGVIQGSSLGPLLFLLYINDISSIFQSSTSVKIFADDFKLYACTKTLIDEFKLQNDLNKLYIWSQKWQLPISIKKMLRSSCQKVSQTAKLSTILYRHKPTDK